MDVSRILVRRCYAELPGFGERVALDSTTLKAWSNGGKTPKTDPDAGWSVKKNTHGKTEFTFGFKLHLAVDCESELPIAANISAGNVHDASRATNVLSEGRFTTGLFYPNALMADAGYSGRPLRRFLARQFNTTRPIIDINKAHKKLYAKYGPEMKTPERQALYRQRKAVERCFSRLKGQRILNNIKVRGRWKVTAHCYLSLIAMQAAYFVGD